MLDFNVGIGDDSTLFILKINNGNIKIQDVDVRFVRKDDFNVDIYDIPVNKYTLEQLKKSTKIILIEISKISLRLNSNVTIQYLKESKKKIK